VIDNLYHRSIFDRSLTTGMAVLAKWHQDGYCYSGRARITKLSRESVQVKMVSVDGVDAARLIGKTLEFPRFTDQTRWSSHNGVQPADEKSLQAILRPM